jgi:hypothetical protein
MLTAFSELFGTRGINYFKIVTMNTNNIDQNSEHDEKHSGGSHIFLFLGGAVIVLVLIKFLIDWLTK